MSRSAGGNIEALWWSSQASSTVSRSVRLTGMSSHMLSSKPSSSVLRWTGWKKYRWQQSGQCASTKNEWVWAINRRGRKIPGFEVDDSQRTSKKSSPASTQPSEDRGRGNWFRHSFLRPFLAVLARPRCSIFLINVIAKSEFSQPFRLQFWWRHCDPAGPQELWKRPRLHVGHSSWMPDSHWLTVAPSLGLAHCTCYLNLNREHQGEHFVKKWGVFFMLLNAAWERALYPDNRWKWRKWKLISCNLF